MKKLKIGSRSSKLALWQAEKVKDLIHENSIESEIVSVESDGDIDLKTPIYELGIQGVFTKSLDIALINNHIDIAVHSYKDVPTKLAEGLTIASVLKRDNAMDVLLYKNSVDSIKKIATSSIRRKAQWLNRFPDNEIFNVRGNVQTRLQKFADENWDAIIFSAAGLERMNLIPQKSVMLDWMLPAPAQGVIVVVCREDDMETLQICSQFNNVETDICTSVERDFLNHLYGGCSAPIGASAEIVNGRILFKGNLMSVDGKIRYEIEESVSVDDAVTLGYESAQKILKMGGDKIINELRKN
jgi:hydroxymethylbilane synthase